MSIFSSIFLFLTAVVCCSGAHEVNFVKVDCHPEWGANEQTCKSRGCVWQSSQVQGEPWCSFDSSAQKFAGYNVDDVLWNTSSYLHVSLIRRPTPTLYGKDDIQVQLRVQHLGPAQLLISFVPALRAYMKFDHLLSHRKLISKNSKKFEGAADYEVDVQAEPFGIRVLRKSTRKIIFDTFNISGGLTHSQQFLSLTTRTPSSNIYGFGEHVHPSLKHNMAWKRWGMFARDSPSSGSRDNLYGVHPFHIGIEDDGNAHGVLLLNSNAQHVELSPAPSITYRTIGGRLDFLVLLGPGADQVIQQYTTLIGLPMLPPYWALGFHLCRFGYKGTNELKQVLGRNQKARIPQDVQWVDIDYMEKRMDFTYDKGNFSDLPKFAQLLKARNMTLVLILDPAILSDDPAKTYQPLQEGLQQNVFIQDAATRMPFQGKVWPGMTFFPDFTQANTSDWWEKFVKKFYDDVNFDGLWIDMNEPASFLAGSPNGCPRNRWNNPPFVPLEDKNIYTKTLCMDAVQYGGRHYDLHSMYGHDEAKMTHRALRKLFPDKRPFLLSRSTFVGTGTYAFHWTGDNTSEWPHLKYSIIGSLEFNFFGIPFVGADICGFNLGAGGKSADEEMCTRWMQLGAFYPFSRNHNSDDKRDQDPAFFSPLSVNSSRNALLVRYKFLPYLYTLLWQSHTTGSTVMRPLFFEFSTDPNTWNIDDQFLWGNGLMIVPILTPQTFIRSVYFPKSRWFSLLNGTEVQSTGQRLNVPIGPYEIALYMRGGSIIPWQEPADTTAQSRLNPMGILAALDNDGNACGTLYWDDGISSVDRNPYSYFTFNVTNKQASGQSELKILRHVDQYKDSVKLDTVVVYGLGVKPSRVQCNKVDIPETQIDFNVNTKTLTLKQLAVDIFNSEKPYNVLTWFTNDNNN